MSDLQRRMQMAGLPPMPPPPNAGTTRGGMKRRKYTPVGWEGFFDRKFFVETDDGKYCVYKKGTEGPLLVCLHGGGFSALSWALFASHVIKSAKCQVIAFDQRGHGETSTINDSDLSTQTLAVDVGSVISTLYNDCEPPPLIVIGHSMGGSVAIHASSREILPSQIGLIVIDVVEGSAMEALAGMHQFIRSRPPFFKSVEHAIEWSVRSGQIKNHESAQVSMIGQIKPVEWEEQSPPIQLMPGVFDTLVEEPEDSGVTSSVFKHAEAKPLAQQQYTWRVNLLETEKYWEGWFTGMSSQFLDVPCPKVLILAGVDRLDKDLSIGQMQGKFQMQVVGKVGHVVHEDAPDKVADIVSTYLVRNKFAEEGTDFHRTFPAC